MLRSGLAVVVALALLIAPRATAGVSDIDLALFELELSHRRGHHWW